MEQNWPESILEHDPNFKIICTTCVDLDSDRGVVWGDYFMGIFPARGRERWLAWAWVIYLAPSPDLAGEKQKDR